MDHARTNGHAPPERGSDRISATAGVAAARRRAPDGAVLLDFDQTLFAGNSTEAFLDTARPSWIAALVLKAIDVLKPWRLLPGGDKRSHVWRDPIRVWAILLLLPWTLGAWRKRHAASARAAIDDALLEASGDRVYVVSYGFRAIIEPLLEGRIPPERIIAAPTWTAVAYRRRSKVALVADALGEETLRSAIVVTDDARLDHDLLRAAAVPVHCAENGTYTLAHGRSFYPFAYQEVKRPGSKHLLKVVLGEDAVALLLATMLLNPFPPIVLVAVVLLTLSFAAVYEIGYAENDQVAALREERPKVPPRARDWSLATIARTNWIASLLIAAPALLLLWVSGVGEAPLVGLGLGWLLLQVAQRVLFALFNRLAPVKRIAPFVGLQLLKTFGPVAATGLVIGVSGVALFLAAALSRAIPYGLYRLTGVRWVTPDQITRLAFFAALLAVGALIWGVSGVEFYVAALMLIWCVFKARHELSERFAVLAT